MTIDRVTRAPNGNSRKHTTIRMKPELLSELRTTAAQHDRTMTYLLESILSVGLAVMKEDAEAAKAAEVSDAETPSAFE